MALGRNRETRPGSAALPDALAALIAAFAFLFTSAIFDPSELAHNLQKNGGFVPGIRPGRSTKHYFENILKRLTVIGAIYLIAVVVLPELLIANLSVPIYLSGTSLLILVTGTVETVAQVQSLLAGRQ